MIYLYRASCCRPPLTTKNVTFNDSKTILQDRPNFQHGFFARIGAPSAASPIVGSFTTLSSSTDSWEQLSSPPCRRQNLAIAAAGVGSALWVGLAPIITQIPGTVPLVSHQAYSGVLRAALIGAY
jgi:hypothetical protein